MTLYRENRSIDKATCSLTGLLQTKINFKNLPMFILHDFSTKKPTLFVFIVKDRNIQREPDFLGN